MVEKMFNYAKNITLCVCVCVRAVCQLTYCGTCKKKCVEWNMITNNAELTKTKKKWDVSYLCAWVTHCIRISIWRIPTRINDRAFSTPSKLPHNDTWLLFSVGFDRFESGKWMCVFVSSMIRLILLPPRPMIYEWSVYEMSIFMMTRLPCKVVTYANI